MKENPDIFVASNVREDGTPEGAVYAGRRRHSDLLYTAEPARASMLLALETASSGGAACNVNKSRHMRRATIAGEAPV